MRCFISLNISNEIKEEFYKIQNEIKKNIDESQIDRIRWEKRDKFHMTLFFLRDVLPEKLKEISNELNSVNLDSKTSDILFKASSINAFPNLKFPRILIVELINEDKKAAELYEMIKQVLVQFNFKPDKNFHPHITLGRVKKIQKVNLVELANKISFDISFTINGLYLMRSKLDYRGSVYKIIKRFPL